MGSDFSDVMALLLQLDGSERSKDRASDKYDNVQKRLEERKETLEEEEEADVEEESGKFYPCPYCNKDVLQNRNPVVCKNCGYRF